VAVTFNQLVDRVKQQLLGYTKDQASITYLVADMNADDSTFQVDTDTVKNISRGLVEIDDELLLVKTFDQASGTVTVMGAFGAPANPAGRGVEGTTAASHLTNALVTDDPMYPRARIKEAINDTINATFPDLWVFGSHEFPKIAARYEYPLPTEVEDVYKVTVNTIGPSAVWFPLSSWRFNPSASTTVGQVKPTPTPTGKTIQIMRDSIVPGRNIRVEYIKKPTVLTNNSDDFSTVTGYPERYVDLIIYGTMWRLLPAYESARLQQDAIEATERAPLVPTGAGSNASKYYMALYQQRLLEERTRLQRLFDSYATYNG
jgi:hypothetical protein